MLLLASQHRLIGPAGACGYGTRASLTAHRHACCVEGHAEHPERAPAGDGAVRSILTGQVAAVSAWCANLQRTARARRPERNRHTSATSVLKRASRQEHETHAVHIILITAYGVEWLRLLNE